MVFITDGTLMTWEEILPHISNVKKQGTMQFLYQYKKYKDEKNYPFYWGDETEYSLIRFDHEERVVQLPLTSTSFFESPQVQALESSLWTPEYAEFMMEGKPRNPFGTAITDLNRTEEHFIERRKAIKQFLGPNESLVSLTAFPRLGCPNFSFPSYEVNKHPTELYKSVFVPDEALSSRLPLFLNIRENFTTRKEERISINVPIYKDKNTMMPYGEDLSEYGDNEEMKKYLTPGFIYMDAPVFGAGCCSIQVTFQAADIKEAAYLYDNLVPLTPIMLPFTAAAPIHRGFLTDVDTRWLSLSQSCDDRTRQERGLEPLTNGSVFIPTTRFDTVCSYLSVSDQFYNDYDYSYDPEQYEVLKAEGVDEMMAKYVAQLLVRDPITLYKEKVHQDVEDTDHIQTIIGSNWHTLKLKLPDEKSGWKIEFRTMELQLTDFENAALVVFMVLLTRAIVTFKLNFLVPITKVTENFPPAQKRDAITKEKFYFRKNVQQEVADCELTGDIYTLMTLNEIMNGKDDFPGLIPLIHKYLDHVDYDSSKRPKIMQYLKFLSDKAAGKIMTMAQWTRQFVRNHEDYKNDSVVSERIAYDFMMECEKIVNSEERFPQAFIRS
ncbi:glutamate--cysteine ligase catalytic subunit-like [Octopus sinensis]|uniref:Glutamate--cysteine ligase n=1 Tax=Octopus sinensis TaxID=2607531 RepID=A0A6P7TS50_9MOLL|nr:glutamate--cysteine ligase catalytic subunit-like [Octopus sinensis]